MIKAHDGYVLSGIVYLDDGKFTPTAYSETNILDFTTQIISFGGRFSQTGVIDNDNVIDIHPSIKGDCLSGLSLVNNIIVPEWRNIGKFAMSHGTKQLLL